MPRTPRKLSASDCYHITIRGAGRRNIFEDDADRKMFLKHVSKAFGDDVDLYAWCLMDNHVHLFARFTDHSPSSTMHRLCTSYALYFNGRHGHVGPVFQGRYAAFPVESDAHFLETVRYIHFNSRDVGVHPKDYHWCSFVEYLGKGTRKGLCNTKRVLDIFGSKAAFRDFHATDNVISLEDLTGYRKRLSEAEVREIVREVIGSGSADSLTLMGREERDFCLRTLYDRGASTRQLERLTGIGRSIIRKACEQEHPC